MTRERILEQRLDEANERLAQANALIVTNASRLGYLAGLLGIEGDLTPEQMRERLAKQHPHLFAR